MAGGLKGGLAALANPKKSEGGDGEKKQIGS